MSAHMVRRFEDVPRLGATVEAGDPLIGWRVERSFNGRFLNVDADGTATTGRCSRTPTGPSLGNILGTHQSPHPRCQCGMRLVGDRVRLSEVWEVAFKLARASGLRLKHALGADDLVILKAQATGYVTPGHSMPTDDPFTTIRASTLRVLEAWTPPWMDAEQVASRNPHIQVRPIAELGGTGFTSLRRPSPPEDVWGCQLMENHLRVITGIEEVHIPRTWLAWPGLMEAARNVVHGGGDYRENILTLVNRLVIPLTDIENHSEQHGIAKALAFGIDFLGPLALLGQNPPRSSHTQSVETEAHQ